MAENKQEVLVPDISITSHDVIAEVDAEQELDNQQQDEVTVKVQVHMDHDEPLKEDTNHDEVKDDTNDEVVKDDTNDDVVKDDTSDDAVETKEGTEEALVGTEEDEIVGKVEENGDVEDDDDDDGDGVVVHFEEDGQVEQWFIEPTNEEVLRQVATAEADNDDAEKPDILKLLAWAKATRKAKTDTMKVREKKREAVYRHAVDVDALPVIIEDSNTYSPTTPNTGQRRRFQVKPAQAFQVRKKSTIQPVSETVVTRTWLENAIRVHEDESHVVLITMKFDRDKDGAYQATVKAEVGPDKTVKTFDWIIREAPKSKVDYDPHDKDTYMVADLGTRLVRFVATKRKRIPGVGAGAAKVLKALNMPFQTVIFADAQYAIFDDMAAYQVQGDSTGLDMDHMRLALKTIARLHAMSYAYFTKSSDDIKHFSEVLKLMIDKYYQPSATPQDRSIAKEQLAKSFDHLLSVIKTTNDGHSLATKAKAKFNPDRLYDIYKAAHVSSSNFSVLCHGNPVQENMRFSYTKEGEARGRPNDVKLVNFQEARYAHAMTDVQVLLCSSMGPKVEEQSEFLLRFVYHESLVGTLQSLDVEVPKSAAEFDLLKKDFKKHEVFGILSGAMQLAELATGTPTVAKKKVVTRSNSGSSGKRVFESKLLGGLVGKGDPDIYNISTPASRARALVEKLV